MDKILFPAYRTHVPEIPSGLSKPSWHLPIHTFTERGIDLDIGPLLLFRGAVIDTATLEYLGETKKTYLRPITETIDALEGEGFIELCDFGSMLEEKRPLIDRQVSKVIQDPLQWRKPIWDSLCGYRGNLPEMKALFGKDYDPGTIHLGFGAYIYLKKNGIACSADEIAKVEKIFLSSKTRWTKAEEERVREIVRPSISYLYRNIALTEMLGAPFIDVDFTSELYQLIYGQTLKILNPQWVQQANEIKCANHLFRACIPHLRPSSPQAMIRLLKDKRLANFKEFVRESASSGADLSKKDFALIFADLTWMQQDLGSTLGVIKWAGRFISLLPYSSPFVVALEELAIRKLRTKKMGRYEWIYALIDNS